MRIGDYIDLSVVLGRTEYRIPRAMRLPDDGLGHCGSLAVLFGDEWVDPRSGGLIGYPAIGERLELGKKQTQRILAGPLGACVRWYGDVPATNVETADQIRRLNVTAVSEVHRHARLGYRATDVSAGSGVLKCQPQMTIVSPPRDRPPIRILGNEY